MHAWIETETKGADFGDERLNRRYELLLARLSDKPTLSIPAACQGWTETAAAYRFFDNDKTDAAKVLKPHHEATVERIKAEKWVIVAQDTTEIELTRTQIKVGGPLSDEWHWGLYLHPLLAMKIHVSKREASTGDKTKKRKQARAARIACVSVRSARVLLRGPARPGGKLPHVYVNVLLVKEEKPPKGEEAIEWLLFTSLPIETFAAVTQVLDYYCCRWEIEVYFRTLKSGCKIEDLQFERQDRYEVCLAMYMIVAWRVLYVLMLGRVCPKMRCDAVLSEAEWKSVFVIAKNEQPPAKPPLLADMVTMIAEMGGYLNRKHDGPPGPKTMWIGLQRMRDFAVAWAAFGPRTTKRYV